MTATAIARSLSEQALVECYRHMVAARIWSTRAFNLQRQGRVGTFAPIDGNEAAVVGAVQALDPATDWVIPQYREQFALQRFGDEVLDQQVLYLRGHPAGTRYPDHVRVWPPQISLASQVPHAMGFAWGLALREEPGVVLTFLGDGATSEGDFYEAGNFAGVLGVPLVIVVINNGWAISTPARVQTAAQSFAAKAEAFGMPGVKVDGRDVHAVYEAVAEARERAAGGGGPGLVEAETYRLGPHTTADDPGRYVPAEELTEAQALDPIPRLATELRERGLWDDDRQEALDAEANERMDRAVEAAEASEPKPDAFFEHLYAEPTPRLRRQRDELRRHLEERGRHA